MPNGSAWVPVLMGGTLPSPSAPRLAELAGHVPEIKDIKGQATAKRALEVAVADGHNLLRSCPISFQPCMATEGPTLP
jgi:predicted ATPase with chaperone activity